jgi:hypothetical protein
MAFGPFTYRSKQQMDIKRKESIFQGICEFEAGDNNYSVEKKSGGFQIRVLQDNAWIHVGWIAGTKSYIGALKKFLMG